MEREDARGGRYRIVVRGRLAGGMTAALDGAEIAVGRTASTISGPLVDQAQIYGMLDRLRDLGVELVSVAFHD